MPTRYTHIKKFFVLAGTVGAVSAAGLGVGAGTAQAAPMPFPHPHPHTVVHVLERIDQRLDRHFPGSPLDRVIDRILSHVE
jgi:hypothetical protein